MFGSLKKRLKDAVSKVSETIFRPEPQKEEPVKDIKQLQEHKAHDISEEIENEVEEKIEKLEEIKEILKEEAEETIKTTKQEKSKAGILGAFRKITEKKLSETDTENVLKELQIALLESDVALEVVEKICGEVKESLINKSVNRLKISEVIKNSLKKAIRNILEQENIDIEKRIKDNYKGTKKPFLIIFLGFNGTGKTTNLCKLAYRLKKYKPVLAAADTFRAAGIEQLEEHGRRLGFDVVKHSYSSDSAAVIFDAVKHAEAVDSMVVLADTAGRNHINTNLMDELKKIIKVNKPDLKVLVMDSLTGNDIYDQSKLFNDAVGVDCVILTKTDVYEKGAPLSASYTIKKPILFFGTGQGYEDMKEFDAEEIMKNIIE